MSKKERTHAKTDKPGPDQPDEQVIINLMEKRRLQQDALKKIITSMDKASDDNGLHEPKQKTKLI
jgi:hypothetical protein